jgi:hypothetical protein
VSALVQRATTLTLKKPLRDLTRGVPMQSNAPPEAMQERTVNAEPKTDGKVERALPSHPVMLTAEQIRTTLGMLECNAPQVGKVIRANERTARRWVSGELQVPPAVSAFLRIALLVARNAPYDEFSAALRSQADLIDDWQKQRRLARKESKIAAKLAARAQKA